MYRLTRQAFGSETYFKAPKPSSSRPGAKKGPACCSHVYPPEQGPFQRRSSGVQHRQAESVSHMVQAEGMLRPFAKRFRLQQLRLRLQGTCPNKRRGQLAVWQMLLLLTVHAMSLCSNRVKVSPPYRKVLTALKLLQQGFVRRRSYSSGVC